jgi:uncharacterized membrane protein YdbT with pleckstrin-like domain
MSYVSDNLMPGERVVFETKVHWVVYLAPALLLAFALGMWYGNPELGDFATFVFLLAFAVGLSAWVRQSTSEFAVTDKRLIAKVGLLRRTTMEMRLSKIESLQIDQDIGGRLLGYGTVRCRGTGSGDQVFKDVDDAMKVRQHVYEQAEALQKREREGLS